MVSNVTREPPAQVSPYVLRDEAQAAVLLDARQRRGFLSFVGRERTVSGAARDAGETPNTMLRRVQRWQTLGLLRVTRVERHARGTRLVYRAVADAFFLPHRVTRHEDMLALVEAVHAPAMTRLRQAYARTGETLGGEWGVQFEVRDGQFDLIPARGAGYRCAPGDEDAPVALLQTATLHLEERAARAMQVELAALIEKYRGQQGPRAFQVMVGVACGEDGPLPS